MGPAFADGTAAGAEAVRSSADRRRNGFGARMMLSTSSLFAEVTRRRTVASLFPDGVRRMLFGEAVAASTAAGICALLSTSDPPFRGDAKMDVNLPCASSEDDDEKMVNEA